MKVVTARQFNQDVGAAKRFASAGPVVITDRGRPTHVLLTMAAYRRLTDEPQGIVDLIAADPGSPALTLPARGGH
ncbi:MAG: type II toxin-antitoxin system Phd/YefM family antitoxin [Altererythrobacter sp.]|nr:type II toxin-antitoxin system Phd/YefM family antitoxin [Altererythrobacter sp.]